MKYTRYIILAVLVYLLVASTHAYFTPVVTLSNGAPIGDSDFSVVIANFRSALLPWLLMISVLLTGWLFANRKLVVYSVIGICIPLFGYLAYSVFSSLGYSPGQSLLALAQGYGLSSAAWLVFYLATIVALPFAARTKEAEEVGAGDAEEAV